MFKPIDYFLVFLTCVVVVGFSFCFPLANSSQFDNHIGNLFDFSAIFSALTGAYLLHWISRNRNLIVETTKDLIRLSHRITDFKRIASILANDHNIWGTAIYSKATHEYSSLKYSYLHGSKDYEHSSDEKLVKKFFDDDRGNLAATGPMLLLLGLREIAGKESWHEVDPTMYDNYDHTGLYTYSFIETLAQFGVANTLWYWLINKRHLNDMENKMTEDSKSRLNIIISKIDTSLHNKGLSLVETLGEIGSDFEGNIFFEYLENLDKVKKLQNDSAPFTLLILNGIILTFGAILPLTLSGSSIAFDSGKGLILQACTAIVIISLSAFILLTNRFFKLETTIIPESILND